MTAALLISLFALLFAVLDSKGIDHNGLKKAFILITCFSCFRYNYGTDYMSYMEEFQIMDRYSVEYILSYNGFKDKGWFLIQHYIHFVGWFIFAALISIYCNVVYYKCIKKYVSKKYYWFSFYIYAFTFDMFLLQQSMIRQGWAIALMMHAFVLFDTIDFKNKKKIITFLFLISLAISIHKSAAFALPFILFKFVPGKYFKIVAIGIVVVFISMFFVRKILENYIGLILLTDEFSSFGSDYGNEDGTKIGVRALIECIPIGVGAYYLIKNGNNKGPYFLIMVSMVAPMVLPLTTIIHLISRVAFYFSMFYIISIPITYNVIKNRLCRCGLIAVFVLVTFYIYIDRFNADSYRKPYSEYHTLFSYILK